MCNIQWILSLLVIISLATSESYFIHGNSSLARFKRQSSQCKVTEHQCGSGECISDDTICDGREDCKDGSDESSCLNFPCQSYLFKCAYGACINSDFECDGKKDCKDNSDETSPKCSNTTSNSNSTNSCGSDQFACDNGECIDDFDLCDGKADCRDASDESVKACGSLKCFNFNFKCAYGACINADLRCNGVNNCYDGSDEKNCRVIDPRQKTTPPPPVIVTTASTPGFTPITVTTAPPTPGSCMLPVIENGRWEMLSNANSQYKSGDYVVSSTVIKYMCNNQHALYPSTANWAICNNSWSVIPKCLKTCPALQSTDIMTLTCSFNGQKIDCSTPYYGTKVQVVCAPFYKDIFYESKPSRYCSDGSWDGLPHCEQVCGLKSVEGQLLVIGGHKAKKGEYPWQVGIYTASNKEQICGGTIITPSITLSAAHCFLDPTPSGYLLAAGKYYRSYDDARDAAPQYSGIKELFIPDKYRGGQPYFANDIAVLVLSTPFRLTQFVLPACFDYNKNFDSALLVDETGIVSGWGYTASTGQSSNELKYLEVKYKTQTTCTLPKVFRPYYDYADDKICAGLFQQGQSACQGDSGGGLVFPMRGKYYIRGIVSVAPRKQEGGCDETQLTLYTSVNFHTDFIENLINKYGGH